MTHCSAAQIEPSIFPPGFRCSIATYRRVEIMTKHPTAARTIYEGLFG